MMNDRTRYPMIHRVQNAQQADQLQQFLAQNPIGNTLILGALEHYTWQSAYCAFYIVIDQGSIVRAAGVLLGQLILSTNGSPFLAHEVEQLCQMHDVYRIQAAYLPPIHLACKYEEHATLAICHHPKTQLDPRVRLLQQEDAQEASRLICSAFQSGITPEEFQTRLASQDSRFMGLSVQQEDGERLVACAGTMGETATTAMVVLVACEASFRGQGFASAVVNTLIHALSQEGKTACLFYTNPIAGKIYHHVGFEDAHNWTLFRLS